MNPMRVLPILFFATIILSTAYADGFFDDPESYGDPVTAPRSESLFSAFKRMVNKGHEPQTHNDPTQIYPAPNAGIRLSARERTRRIQQGLNRLGYSPGPADGVAGKTTKRAIFNFQLDQGMQADGKPSHQVLQTIESRKAVTPHNRQAAPTRVSRRQLERCVVRVNRFYPNRPPVRLTSSQYEALQQQNAAAKPVELGLLASIALAPVTGGASLVAGGAYAGANSDSLTANNPAAGLQVSPEQMELLQKCLNESR